MGNGCSEKAIEYRVKSKEGAVCGSDNGTSILEFHRSLRRVHVLNAKGSSRTERSSLVAGEWGT